MTASARVMLGLAAASLAGAAAAFIGNQSSDTADRVAGWRRDLDHLVSEARRQHAGPARPAHGRAFAAAAAELSRRIPELSDRRVAVEFQQLLAMLHDGHSLVYPMPSARMRFDMLPVDVYLFEDGLFVIEGTGPARELIGSRIEKFGPRTTEEVLGAMAPFVSRDNDVGLKAFASLYPIVPAFLEAWGATGDPDRVALSVVDRTGATRAVTLAAGPARRVRRRLVPPPGSSEPPLYLQEMNRIYLTRALSGHGALYFRFNEVADAPDGTLATWASRLRDDLASAGAKRLIVDVRHNFGGNNRLLEPMLATIAGFAASPGRRVYVLTSRTTFSAAQNFITRLERRLPSAVFAGEPSMSRPNFTGEDNPVTLPFSGLTISISNRHWQDSEAADARPWIAPHLPVSLSSGDWLANRDPVLDAVLAAIEKDGGLGAAR